MSKCDYCADKSECDKCDMAWKDRFIPNDDVRPYFVRHYCGVRGINGFTWDFDTTNTFLHPTHSIRIGNGHYCPYCGEAMYPIQDPDTFDVTGYRCICPGAESEIDYERKRQELEKRHEEERLALMKEYEDKLSFCSEKLLDIKQKKEKESLQFFSHRYNHFSTVNGEPYRKIEQIL